MHMQLSIGYNGLNFELTLYRHPYFVIVRAVKAMARLRVCTDSSEESLVAYVIARVLAKIIMLFN